MELTSLTLALVLGLGLLGADTVLRSGSVEVEVAIAPKVENISVDKETLASRFKDQLDEITSRPRSCGRRRSGRGPTRASAWHCSRPSMCRTSLSRCSAS